jgi:hypothetical protein
VEWTGFFRESVVDEDVEMQTAAKTFQMLDNETLWLTAQPVHDILEAGRLPHAIVGGVAVSLHGYRRNRVNVDLLIRKEGGWTYRSRGFCTDRCASSSASW